MAIMIHRKLDFQGRPSALAVEHTDRAMLELSAGDLIEVLATDPTCVSAFAAWSRRSGNTLLESSQFGNVFRFVIRRA